MQHSCEDTRWSGRSFPLLTILWLVCSTHFLTCCFWKKVVQRILLCRRFWLSPKIHVKCITVLVTVFSSSILLLISRELFSNFSWLIPRTYFTQFQLFHIVCITTWWCKGMHHIATQPPHFWKQSLSSRNFAVLISGDKKTVAHSLSFFCCIYLETKMKYLDFKRFALVLYGQVPWVWLLVVANLQSWADPIDTVCKSSCWHGGVIP